MTGVMYLGEHENGPNISAQKGTLYSLCCAAQRARRAGGSRGPGRRPELGSVFALETVGGMNAVAEASNIRPVEEAGDLTIAR